MSYSKLIAIDGPCGSGKSTLAKKLARELGILYVDTGAMFRALGYVCQQRGISFEDEAALESFLGDIQMGYGISEQSLISIDGEDLSIKIREHHVSQLASLISKVTVVRNFLLKFQRKLAQRSVCVMEGRDIGTVVFPDAFCKIFLTARPEVRAKRRLDELVSKGASDITLEQVLRDVLLRDQSDMAREVAPLKQAEDAQLLDTSNLTMSEVLLQLQRIVEHRAGETGIYL